MEHEILHKKEKIHWTFPDSVVGQWVHKLFNIINIDMVKTETHSDITWTT